MYDWSTGSYFETSSALPHAREDVFATFTDPDVLARWWGPSDCTSRFPYSLAPRGFAGRRAVPRRAVRPCQEEACFVSRGSITSP
jgi:uncharacterized protein YndB with AHSA1/START domain